MGILDMIRRKQESGTRKFYDTIQDDHVADDAYDPAVLTKDRDYFRIWLCEMFLKDKTNYISGFIPMAVALNSFDYGGASRDIPVLVGSQILNEVERYVKDQDIEFRNVPIIGPIPYTGANVSLFIGLYRVEVDNLARSLFGVIDSIVGAFDIADLSTYLNVAGRVGEGLGTLIGLPQVDMRFGTMDTFGAGGHALRDRYLVFINCPEGEIELDDLRVEKGRLYYKAGANGKTPYTGHDYCLVRIERLENRPDIESLPFHKIYLDCTSRIWEENLPEAERLFLNLMRDLTRSADLTTEDRSTLMKTYLANYQQEKENHATVTGVLSSRMRSVRQASRGAAPLSATAAIQRAAGLADCVPDALQKRNDLVSVQESLQQLARQWKEIPHLENRKARLELDAAKISDQFRAVKASQKGTVVTPEALADVINYSAFQGV